MRCLKHRRSVVGACQWCGTQLCVHCISKKEGKKVYCEKCTIRLSGVRRTRMPPPPSQIIAPEKQDLLKDRRQQQTQNKYAIDKDGYLIIEQ